MNLVNNDRTTKIISVVLSVIFGVLFISLVADAVTTISTNIVTDGNLSATLATTTSATSTRALFGSDITGNTLSIGGSASTTINSAGNLLVIGSTTLQRFTFTSATSTTSNSATSTLEVGCIQMYATSTATAVRFLFHASSTISTTVTGTASGYLLWGYGTCPF